MSRASGEKARANIQKRNRTARRAKDRARLAEIKSGGENQTAVKPPKTPTRQSGE